MNAIDFLTKQHRLMEAALKAVRQAEGQERQERFAKAADLLMSHVVVEERLFYPAVVAKRTEDTLLESLEEHLSLKRLLADLLALPAGAAEFEPKFHVLAEQAEHHHEEEEEKLFPEVKRALSRAELRELGERMYELQAELLAKAPRKLASQQISSAALIGSHPGGVG
jgi:hemerythrin superfamily protein